LKPGATVVVVDPDPEKDKGNPSSEYTSKEEIEREAGEAGFELIRVETFLEKDNIFILRRKQGDAGNERLRRVWNQFPYGPSVVTTFRSP